VKKIINIVAKFIFVKMIRKIFVLFLFTAASLTTFAGEIVIKGNYYGFNLYIDNPSVGKGFCVTKVLVNDVETKDEIQSNSFEVDFSQLNIKIGDPITVVIKHKDGCTPAIANPKALQKSVPVTFAYAKMDKSGKLTWGITGEMPDDVFIIEQFRWNKWVKIAEVSSSDTLRKNSYAYEFAPHFGMNQFRIIRNDDNGNPVYSKLIKYTSRTTEINLESVKVSDKLIFSAETQYEIFDMKGNFITEGFGKEVDVTDLEKGKYWVNFDNKSLNFTHK
jgi:hypothetical protein